MVLVVDSIVLKLDFLHIFEIWWLLVFFQRVYCYVFVTDLDDQH